MAKKTTNKTNTKPKTKSNRKSNSKSSKKTLTPMFLSIFMIILVFSAIAFAEYIYETPWEDPAEDEASAERIGEDDSTEDDHNKKEDEAANANPEEDQHTGDEDNSDSESGTYDSGTDDSDSDTDDRDSADSDSDKNNSDAETPPLSVAEKLGVSPVSYTRFITTDLNIRGDAHNEAKRLGVFSIGTEVHVIGELSNSWVQVDYGSTDAFIHSAYLSTTDPTARPPSREDSATVVSNPGAVDVLINRDHKLPSSFVPPNLVEPSVRMAPNTQSRLIRSEAAAALEEMFTQAEAEEIILYARSGYRSYNTQKNLFNSYVRNHGYDSASRFSAQPGHSEHQLGLAMDVTSESANYSLTQSFGSTIEGQWVAANAHRFGFILRYPQGKEAVTSYMYEPWHLRYVGKDLAPGIYTSGLTYEEYLGY